MRLPALPFLAALALTACVTINVYFPAAEAREAAREFVEDVIGQEAGAQPPAGDGGGSDRPGQGMQGGMAALPRSPVSGTAGAAPRGVQPAGGFDPWMLLGIGTAHAQTPDITIRTPAIQAIRQRMESRFQSTLRPHFDSGALGFGGDGLVVVRDASQLPLRDRAAVNAAVADDNRDRNAVYREIAVANGHPEWEPQIREVFARQWIASARAGWWYQQGGSWRQK